ncbi:enteropeptidase-like [Lethenteron reissneri]|uniref:enteropeptidase-like n=1 Tax=Lethenteron reissneri TaxID=7753 RepID=UPI002AB693CB|nr:enteropeptidase-like [Lethenteron reissneri]
MEEVKGKRSSRWTSLEVTLIVFCALGTVVCAGLIAVAWLAIDDNSQLSAKDETNEISGKMKIVGGASYSPRLHDPTSTEFKILAFDVEHTINKVYSESSMKDDYAGCRVVAFEQGSVWVLLGLKFTLATSEGLVGTAQGTLLAAISPSTPVSNVGFLPPFEVDIASVQVYGDKPSTPTSKPTPAPNNTSAPTSKPTPAPNKTSAPTSKPTPAPNKTSAPTFKPTPAPNKTSAPTSKPTPAPNNTSTPTFKPTPAPNNTSTPTFKPTPAPNNTSAPTFIPTPAPNNTSTPTFKPTPAPNTSAPTFIPTPAPNNTSTSTFKPTPAPNNTSTPTFKPTPAPNKTSTPTFKPTPASNNASTATLKSTLVPVTSKESCGSVELWEPNTTFSSPNYPNNYSVNTLCFWFLRAQEGDNVQLHFQDFDTETDNDMVMVYDGNSTSAMLIGMFSGSGPGRDLFSTGSVMTVRFRSDFVTNCKGFLANFTTGFRLGMPPLCGSDEFQCDNYQCVPSSAVCDGRPDCTDTSDEKRCARLVNGTVVASGVVQLFVHGRWRGLCANDSWEELARNICLSTGYPGLNGSALVAAAGYGPYVSLFVNSSSSSVGAVISESCDAGRVLYVNCIPKACGRRRRLVPESRVVQGSDAAPGAWPWMVDLRSKGQHLCGASLLSRDWLLTAAHCVRGHEAVDLTAAFGLRSQLNFSSSGVEQRLVAQVHGHRDYNHYSKDNDIALLRLASPVN